MVMVYYELEHFFPCINNSLRLVNINKMDIAVECVWLFLTLWLIQRFHSSYISFITSQLMYVKWGRNPEVFSRSWATPITVLHIALYLNSYQSCLPAFLHQLLHFFVFFCVWTLPFLSCPLKTIPWRVFLSSPLYALSSSESFLTFGSAIAGS